MDEEPVNHPLCRLYFFILSAPLFLAGCVMLYAAVDEWITWYGDETAWIIFPAEILAPAGCLSMLFGSTGLYFVFRPKKSWPAGVSTAARCRCS
jgi:hypothetical protein